VVLAFPAAIAAKPLVSTSHSYVVTSTAIGGFKVSSGWTQAHQIFGGPVSSTQDHFICTARWPDGLTLTFARHYPLTAWSKACKVFKSAKVTGKSWRTDKGLRIGSAESQIKHLYPGAVKKSTTVWIVNPKASPQLQASVKKGKVASIQVIRSTS
jgi:hypothetical protein